MHSMLSRCKNRGIFQPAFICIVFDVFVVPVLWPAHVWGPSMFQEFLSDPFNSKNDSKRVHWQNLRLIAGMGRSVTKSSFTRDLGGTQSCGSGWCWLHDGVILWLTKKQISPSA